MSYLSYQFLEKYAITNFAKRAELHEAKASSPKYHLFLSHSTADDAVIDKVTLFFAEFGTSVYTDDVDKELPKHPDTTTAQLLKDRINECLRFVVLVSPNSRSSRWIPWELGVADGIKGVAPIAILPITQGGSEEEWTKEEYFGLYPRIRYDGTDWLVLDPRDNRTWKLDYWLKHTVT